MTKAAKKPVAIYLRVSTVGQVASGLGLEDQWLRCRAHAASQFPGHEIVEFRDAGVSAKGSDAKQDTGRPAMEELRESIRRRKVHAVIALRIDRLARNTLDLLTFIKEAKGRGVAVATVVEQIDTSTPHGRLVISILAAVAEMDREQIGLRVKAAHRVRRSQGVMVGWAPYGSSVGDDGKLATDDGEQATLALIAQRRAEGASYRAIAKELTTAGHPTKRGGQWRPATVKRILDRVEEQGAVSWPSEAAA